MKKLVFCLSVCGFIWAGCNKNEPKENLHDEAPIEIIFLAKSQGASMLKSTPGTQEEDAVDRIILFGVDASAKSPVFYSDTIEGSELTDALSSSGTPLLIPRKVTTLYAIANPSQDLEEQLDTVSNVSVLTTLVEDFTVAPYPDGSSSFLLMGGNGVVDYLNKEVTIALVRAVAKVQFIGMNDFVVTSVAVAKTPDLGFVFGQTPLAVPPDTSMVSYALIPEDIVYVAENIGGVTEAPTKFTVSGTLNSQTASYTFALTQSGTLADIVRNTFYSVNISPKSDTECDIFITIKPWEDGIVDEIIIPDENFEPGP